MRSQCKVPKCHRESHGNGYCLMHFKRIRAKGEPGSPFPRRTFKVCSVGGCGKKHHAKRFCALHFYRFKTHGDPFGGRTFCVVNHKCSVKGCGKKNHARGYCAAHFCKFRKYGDPLYSLPKRKKKCKIGCCKKTVIARGLCDKHYRRWKTHGNATLSERPNYGTGRFTTEAGYVMVRMPDHPNAGQTGYVSEHVLVMARILGRPLRYPETVHHKNGIRDDNRPSNLELWSKGHRPGQRVSDLLNFSLELLITYHKDESVFTAKTKRLFDEFKKAN
jgi:hypothetical protein